MHRRSFLAALLALFRRLHVTIGSVALSLSPDQRIYTPGATVRASAALSGTVGGLVFRIAYPSGSVLTYTFGIDVEVVSDGSNVYHLDFVLDSQGTYRVRVDCTGALEAVAEREFQGDESVFYTSIPQLITQPIADPTEEGTVISSNGFSYVPRRFAIIPDIDPNGGTDATARILAAANQRTGAWVYLPDGKYKVGSTSGAADIFDLTALPKGTTISGPERGQKSGHRLYNDGNPAVGATLYVYGTGRLFVSGEQKCFANFEVYYPNQVKTGAPTPYGYAFDITGHGCSVHSVTTVNPYDLLRCGGSVGGCDVDHIWGFPLHRGIYLGRVTDVARVHRCNFNPAADWQSAIGSGSTLPAWVAANGAHFLVDGAEAFQFSECFSYGAAIGFSSNDEDGDAYRGSGGKWEGGGFDQCTVAFRFTKGMWQGMTVTNCSIAPPAGAYGILFEDTTVPAVQWQRAKVHFFGLRTSGPHFRTCQMGAGATYGQAFFIGGQFYGGPTSAIFGNDSTNPSTIVGYDDIMWDSTYTLKAGAGAFVEGRRIDGTGAVVGS